MPGRFDRSRLVVLVVAGMAPAALAAPTGDAARVDWAAGRVVAGGTSVADRHAPSPAVALGTSRRGAEQVAKRRIAAMLGGLPMASGGTVADQLAGKADGKAGAARKARLDAAVEAAIAIAAEPETDGSWHVTLAVPLEAIRQALDEPRALPAAGDGDPAVVVVEGVAGKPAIGWTINGAAAATLWVKDAPGWAKDAPRVKVGAASQGALTIDGKAGGPATLYVLISRK